MRRLGHRLALAALAAALKGLGPGPAAADEPIVAYTITDGTRIAESLTGKPGDPEAGRALYAAERAGCAGCHGDAAAAPPPFAGLGPGEIRLWIAAPDAIDPETAMPAYYAPGDRLEPDDPLYGGPRLTAGEIEDLVAYLAGLTGAAP